MNRIILAIIVGVVTALVLLLLGNIFSEIGLDWVQAIGRFLKTYSSLIGLLAGLWYYFNDRKFPTING